MVKSVIPIPPPRIFQREYVNADGTTEVWKYDLDKSRGPIETTTTYPKNYKTYDELLEEDNQRQPITQRKWVNPANNKLVGYGRAKALGLVKDEPKKKHIKKKSTKNIKVKGANTHKISSKKSITKI